MVDQKDLDDAISAMTKLFDKIFDSNEIEQLKKSRTEDQPKKDQG